MLILYLFPLLSVKLYHIFYKIKADQFAPHASTEKTHCRRDKPMKISSVYSRISLLNISNLFLFIKNRDLSKLKNSGGDALSAAAVNFFPVPEQSCHRLYD